MSYEMWAWLVDDVDGQEGVCSIRRFIADGGQELLCLHHRDREEAEAMRPMAELQTEMWGRPVRLAHLAEPDDGYLRMALDYIDGHDLGTPDAGRLAKEALAGTWQVPGCCYGHGLERVQAGQPADPR